MIRRHMLFAIAGALGAVPLARFGAARARTRTPQPSATAFFEGVGNHRTPAAPERAVRPAAPSAGGLAARTFI